MSDEKQYYAFISYKREDKREAKRLQHQLEYYRLPNQLRKDNPDLPEYVRPVFRDMTDLEVGELSTLIHEALEQSHYLIVVCSPRAAQSKWVNDEVEYFISLGKQDKIIPYIIEGIPHAEDPSEECYPPALLQLSKEKELLGANINEVGKEAAGIRVVAKMFNIRFDTLFQRYQREQKRRRRLLWSLIFVLALVSLSITYIIWNQNINLRETQQHMQRNLARAVTAKAERCLDNNEAYLAVCLALQVLPSDNSSTWTYEADEFLRKSLYRADTTLGYKLIHELGNKVLDVSCNTNGDYIYILTNENIILLSHKTKDIVFSTQTRCGHLAFNPCKNDECAYYDDYGHLIVCHLTDFSTDTLICDSTIKMNTTICYNPNGEQIIYISESLGRDFIKCLDIKSKTSSFIATSLKDEEVFEINSICYNPHSTLLISYSNSPFDEILWDECEQCSIFETSTFDQYAQGVDEFINETYGTGFDWTGYYFIPKLNTNIFNARNENMLLADGKHEGDIVIYDIKKQKLIKTLSCKADNRVLHMQYNKTGTRVLAVYANGGVTVWDLESNTYSTSLNLLQNLHACSATFTAVDDSIIVCLTDGRIIIWDLPPYKSLIASATKRMANRELTPEKRRKYKNLIVNDRFPTHLASIIM